MKFLLFGAAFAFAIFCTFAIETDEDFEAESRTSNAFVPGTNVESRSSKECIKRYHDCTKNRHGCCRGDTFKDQCTCFYTEDTKEEFCTCQEPPHYKLVDKAIKGAKKAFGRSEGTCIAKHHECTHHTEECCKGNMFKYNCHCYKVMDDKDEVTRRCACITPMKYQAIEGVAAVGKAFVKA